MTQRSSAASPMAGQLLNLGGSPCFIDYSDGEGSATIKGRTYRWDWHEYLGPTFIRADGEALKRQPGASHPVWPHFDEWMKAYRKAQTPRSPSI